MDPPKYRRKQRRCKTMINTVFAKSKAMAETMPNLMKKIMARKVKTTVQRPTTPSTLTGSRTLASSRQNMERKYATIIGRPKISHQRDSPSSDTIGTGANNHQTDQNRAAMTAVKTDQRKTNVVYSLIERNICYPFLLC